MVGAMIIGFANLHHQFPPKRLNWPTLLTSLHCTFPDMKVSLVPGVTRPFGRGPQGHPLKRRLPLRASCPSNTAAFPSGSVQREPLHRPMSVWRSAGVGDIRSWTASSLWTIVLPPWRSTVSSPDVLNLPRSRCNPRQIYRSKFFQGPALLTNETNGFHSWQLHLLSAWLTNKKMQSRLKASSWTRPTIFAPGQMLLEYGFLSKERATLKYHAWSSFSPKNNMWRRWGSIADASSATDPVGGRDCRKGLPFGQHTIFWQMVIGWWLVNYPLLN